MFFVPANIERYPLVCILVHSRSVPVNYYFEGKGQSRTGDPGKEDKRA